MLQYDFIFSESCLLSLGWPSKNKLAKARKMRKPPNTISLKKFGLGNLWVKKVFGSKKFCGSNKNFKSKKFFGSRFLRLFEDNLGCPYQVYHKIHITDYNTDLFYGKIQGGFFN